MSIEMNPFKAALWVTKFIATLILLLGVIPTAIYVAVDTYQTRQAARRQRLALCSSTRADLSELRNEKAHGKTVKVFPDGSTDDLDAVIAYTQKSYDQECSEGK